MSGASVYYVGSGETATRQVNLGVATTLTANGSGALVLSNLVNSGAVAKALTLRGYSMDMNTISSALRDNAGALSITKSDGGTWVLSGASTYTGGTTINAGFLGTPAASVGPTSGAFGAGSITFASNWLGGLIAMNAGGLTINNPLIFGANGTPTLSGSSVNLVGSGATPIVLQSAGNWNINNTTSGGVTFSGAINSQAVGNQDLNLLGPGNYVFNTPVVSVTAAGLVRAVVNTLGSVTFNNAAATNTQGILMNQGTVIMNAAQPFMAAGQTGGIVNMAAGTLQSANAALTTGANALQTPLVLTNWYGVIDGTNSIEFVPSITPYQFVRTNGVCNAFAPVVRAAFADCNVPAAMFTIPPVCPAAMNGCAAFMITVPWFIKIPCVFVAAALLNVTLPSVFTTARTNPAAVTLTTGVLNT